MTVFVVTREVSTEDEYAEQVLGVTADPLTALGMIDHHASSNYRRRIERGANLTIDADEKVVYLGKRPGIWADETYHVHELEVLG